MQIDLAKKPSRDAAIDSAGYWDGIASGQFLVQRCNACGLMRHYPRPMCSACHGMTYAWVPVCGRATMRSWTVCHHAFLSSFKDSLPYVLALAELEEGVRVNLPLLDQPITGLRIGLPVQIRITSSENGPCYPVLYASAP